MILTLFVALVAGTILQRLKFPGGMLVGAILGVAILSIFHGGAYIPTEMKTVAQMMAGIYVGSTVRREDVYHMPRLAGPIVVLLATLTIFSISVGVLLSRLGYMDSVTAMMCAVPGGMSNTPIIAADFGADVATVTVVQFARMMAGIAVFPMVITTYARRILHISPVEREEGEQRSASTQEARATTGQMYLAIMVGLLAGGVGVVLSIPAGAMIFSMIAIICFKMRGVNLVLPVWFRRVAQLCSGAYIGTSFTGETVSALRLLVIPILFILGGYLLISVILGYVFHRVWGMDQGEAMLACTPAGASDMALIAADLGVQSADLVIIQVARFVFAVGGLPPILMVVTSFL